MGSCSCKRVILPPDKKQIKQQIVTAIEQKQLKKIQDVFEMVARFSSSIYKRPLLNVDEPVTNIQGFDINALAYSVRLGSYKIFKYLYEEQGASLKEMEKCYKQVGKTGLAIACENGHFEIVKYYLPIYLANLMKISEITPENSSYEQLSIFSDEVNRRGRSTLSHTPDINILPSTATPMHRACEFGSVEIVAFLFTYFSDKECPEEFDVHAVDERTGENCALIAARNCHMDLIKFLHERCKANFHLCSKRAESAIQIAIIAQKKRNYNKLLATVRYLVETVGVDLTYEYEETLLACDHKETSRYIEGQLEKRGFTSANKSRIDCENSLTRNRPPRPRDYALEDRCRGIGKEFEFARLFADELEAQDSVEEPSSIDVYKRTETDNITPLSLIGD